MLHPQQCDVISFCFHTFVTYWKNRLNLYLFNFSCPGHKDCSNCSWSRNLTECTSLPTSCHCSACSPGNTQSTPQSLEFTAEQKKQKYQFCWLQVLPLAQQLDTKPQPGHLPSIEAASGPVAPVVVATVATTSTLIAPGQTADTTTTGMGTRDPCKICCIYLQCA